VMNATSALRARVPVTAADHHHLTRCRLWQGPTGHPQPSGNVSAIFSGGWAYFLMRRWLLASVVCRSPLPAPPISIVAVGGGLQEQLLVWKEELVRREEALTSWEEKVGISEKALIKVSANLDAERLTVEAT
jgi:hypothetical protein